MANNDEIVFDDKSGISVEEQKEILSQINGIAEKNRRLLSEKAASREGESKSGQIAGAKKSGAVFPLAVNISAAVVLLSGAIFLISFNGKMDEQVRTGGAVYNVTERALIDDIRKDTAEKIAAKEIEISAIVLRMEDVDSKLLELYSSNQSLTAEQLAAQNRLLAQQSAFREELSILQTERSSILEDSRLREARLRAQLEERTRELAAGQAASRELDAAVGELERLTSEQERLAVIDAHFSGGVASVSGYIQNRQYAQAENSIAGLREFLQNNSLGNSRAYRSKREYYNQALNLMETVIVDAHRNSGAVSLGEGGEQSELTAKNVLLEEKIAEMQKNIDALSGGSSGQARRLAELEATIASLRETSAAQEQRYAERDRAASSLEVENVTLSASNVQLQSANTAYEQEIASLKNQLTIIRQALQD